MLYAVAECAIPFFTSCNVIVAIFPSKFQSQMTNPFFKLHACSHIGIAILCCMLIKNNMCKRAIAKRSRASVYPD